MHITRNAALSAHRTCRRQAFAIDRDLQFHSVSSTRVNAEVGSAANSYEILAKLAMGGMAEIFLARGASAAGVERYVVLKRVLRHRANEEGFIKMFLDEARLAAQLQHPNIAQVYDIGKLGDSYFFTMEYVHGETVRTLLQRSHALRRPIPIGSVLSVVAGSAAGLHHAHDRKGMDGKPLGIVHRDVSPSNLMVSYEGTVKVVDFGVAKAAHRDTETRSGTVKGKITYMSPEQCKGGDMDRRSDLFSLGIVMWEMLTTERLFRRNSDFENMQAIVAEDVPPPSSLRPEIPPEIDGIVMKLLAKRVADRFQTADEVHEAIENAAVRTGSALSAASLGRFMRELFGQRPEPWIELQTNDAHPEAFTVTSEPISPNNLRPSPEDELDMKLSSIPELPNRVSAMTAAARPPSHADRPLQPTVPFRVQAEDLAVTHHRQSGSLPNLAQNQSGSLPQLPQNRAGTPAVGIAQLHAQGQAPAHSPSYPTLPMPAATVPPNQAHMQSFTPSQSAAMGMGPAPMRPHSPSVTPQSSPQYPVLGSNSHSTPSYSAMTAPPEERKSRALIVLIPACVLGVVIGLVMALRGGDKPADDTTTVAMTPGVESTETKPDQGSSAAAGDPTVGSGSDVKVDTKPVETKPDDTKPDDIQIDTKPDTKPTNDTNTTNNSGGGGGDTKKPDKTTKIKTTKDPKDTNNTPPPPRDDVATLFKANKFADVVQQCNASAKIVALNSTACTLAACKQKDAAKAKKWLPSVGSAKRASVIKECDGVLPADKPVSATDACKRDPLACQH